MVNVFTGDILPPQHALVVLLLLAALCTLIVSA